jgi:hypothetical protein
MSTTLELYEQLKPKLGDAEARSLLEFIETTVIQKAATKDDLALLEQRLKLEMAELRSDLIKWMFGFWIGNVAVLTGIMFTLLKTVK